MGDTGPTYIMTLDDLVQYHDTTRESEEKDKASMIYIINPSTSGIQQNLIQWASAGFPVDYRVLSVALIHPSPCSMVKFGICKSISFTSPEHILHPLLSRSSQSF